jgi:hypothetical protein
MNRHFVAINIKDSYSPGVKPNVFTLPNNNNDFVAISMNYSSYPPSAKLYCNLCNCNLILLDAKAEHGSMCIRPQYIMENILFSHSITVHPVLIERPGDEARKADST